MTAANWLSCSHYAIKSLQLPQIPFKAWPRVPGLYAFKIEAYIQVVGLTAAYWLSCTHYAIIKFTIATEPIQS